MLILEDTPREEDWNKAMTAGALSRFVLWAEPEIIYGNKKL